MIERRWQPAKLPGTLANPGGRNVDGLLDYEPYSTNDEEKKEQERIQRAGATAEKPADWGHFFHFLMG